MKLRFATTLVLLSSTVLSFQNCAPSIPVDDGVTESASADSSSYGGSIFTGGGSSVVPLGSSNGSNNTNSTAPTPTPTPGPAPLSVSNEGRIAVYRVYNSQNGDHLFTINKDEAGALDRTPEWQIEGIAFVLFTNGGNARMPVYRCYNPVAGQHYVSHDANCEAQGMRQEGLLGYVSTILAETSTAPLYRCVAIQPPLRFLATTQGGECGSALLRIDYQYGFVMPPSMAP